MSSYNFFLKLNKMNMMKWNGLPNIAYKYEGN